MAEPHAVAFFLASYARDALARVEAKATLAALNSLREALGQSLGTKFLPGQGEHLFRSTLVQTLFYGLFSAWVTHARSGGGNFDWRTAEWSLHVPMVRALYQQVATPTHLLPLGLVEVLDWAARALDRVERVAFFTKFDDKLAVQYFYEPFLEAFDPILRKQLGVWYTPPEVVRYMVERVDRELRNELGILDGLADPNVWVLDPACGTGSYVVEVLYRIEKTLREKGEEASVAAEIKAAATCRIAGFEIMPAPFVIAHWQIGNLLRDLGAPLDDETNERASVYLTNSLTGWNSASSEIHLPFPELETERDLAADVKRTQPILVVLGNPPYNAYSGTSPVEEAGLVEAYKVGLNTLWRIKKFSLDDLYIRFLRIAERRIAETTKRGIVCYITNFSYLSYRSFVVMRERFVRSFDKIWIDCLNGDARQTGKVTPNGLPDPSVFSTSANPEGIRVGTAIALMVRKDDKIKNAHVEFRHFWGADKREDLENTLKLDYAAFALTYSEATPSKENRYALIPDTVLAIYRSWPSLAEISESAAWSGIVEKRKGALIDHDRKTLAARMAQYLDPSLAFDIVRNLGAGPISPAARFRDPEKDRKKILALGGITAGRFARIALHPFDDRWCFHTNVGAIWNQSRPEVAAQQERGSAFIATRAASRKSDEGFPVFMTRALPGDHLLDPNTHPFPTQLSLALQVKQSATPNLSPKARQYLVSLGLSDWLSAGNQQVDALWWHCLAIAYAPMWLEENEDGIRQDWPRVPLPNSAELLTASIALGRQLGDLLDPQKSVVTVTTGDIDPVLRSVAVLTKIDGTAASSADYEISAPWGALNSKDAVMPGTGRVEQRRFSESESVCSSEALGEETYDVYLNDKTFWRNVPDQVWNLHIGGYPVLKKWLSYKHRVILGRPLTLEEARHFRDTARRLAKLRLMGPELDLNYRQAADNPYSWGAG